MQQRAPRWHGWIAGAGLACALAVVAEWVWHLAGSMPAISRSDHLKSMWRIAPAVNEGAWGAVLAWVFEFGGGHIIGYARALQLVNYLFFDYSGAFIRLAAIGCFVLTWAAIAFAVLRTFGFGLASAMLLPWSAWLVCSPVLANLVAWPEGAPPFLATTLVAALFVPWLAAGGRRAIAAGTLAMAFTNGAGFAFLPAALAVHLKRPQAALMAGLLAALLAALLALTWALRASGIRLAVADAYSLVDLGMALESLQRLLAHPAFFVKYYLAMLALPFAPFRVIQIWPYGLAAAAYTALVLVLTDHRRPGPQRGWLVLAWFGLFAAAAVALGRYGYIDPTQAADAVISSHYAAVVMPLYVALGALTLLLLRSGPPARRVGLAVLAAAVAAGLGHKRLQVGRDFSGVARTEMAIQSGARNWNIYAAAASLGDAGVGQIALVRLYPELKAWRKYPELTRDLIVDPASIGLGRASRDAKAGCGALVAFGPDTRHPWATPPPGALLHSPQVLPFTRAVGYLTCAAEYVVMYGEDGAPQCVSRPGPLATYFTEPELKARPGMGDRSFDFSCPGGKAASVRAFDAARQLLVELRVQQ